jgi:uroporphyrinogen decarboxylase
LTALKKDIMIKIMFIPDYHNIVKAAKNEKLDRIPLYDHSISTEIMEKIKGRNFTCLYGGDYSDKKEYYRHYNQFFVDMGYDTVSWECCAGSVMPGSGSLGGHKEGEIQNRKDFDKYPWNSIPDIFFDRYKDDLRAFGAALPEGVKGIGGVGNGVFECVQEITGFENLCYIRADDYELYNGLFQKTGDMLVTIWTRFLREYGDLFCVCRMGDDLGYKSSTLLPSEDICEFIIPQYRRVIEIIHAKGKPFLLHSCGCIFNVMDDLITAGINAKHSNEDVIAPYSRWIDDYGGRIGNFGGIDTDVLCDTSNTDVVSYTKEIYSLCETKGRGTAIGSGNSIPPYVSVDKYCQMNDTVRKSRKD